MKALITGSLVLLLAGCSWLLPGANEDADGPLTLADLQPAVMPTAGQPLPRVDLETLATTYREVLQVSDDPELRLRVLHRLAGLEMKKGEQQLYEDNAVSGQFTLAIEAYQTLLERHPNHPRNDRLLYQLSKAYDLSGQSDQSMDALNRLVQAYPDSPHFVEAQFRRGEIFFARGNYPGAEQAYAEVIRHGEGSQHYANALYMHGWSQFKRERFRASLASFTSVLDLYVPGDNDLSHLTRGQRELTRDTFRIMSVVFSYLDGPQTITEFYNRFGQRHYIAMIYDNLGKLYLEKERFKDSAEAYRAFVRRYPDTDQAPVFYGRLIEAYIAGGFAQEVLQEKEHYIDNYGIHSDYWLKKSESSRDYIRPFLEIYLPELARHFHARAQEKTAQLNAGRSADGEESLSQRKKRELKRLATGEYVKAGDYYREFIDTFPAHAQVPEMYYLLAESRFEAERYEQAIRAYEIVAYQYSNHLRGAAAGYSAIIAYRRLLTAFPEQMQNPEYEPWLRLKIDSQLKFAATYPRDSHSNAVLTKSAEELLALKEYERALLAATDLVERQPPADNSHLKTAWLVMGHSEFELARYANAEAAYSRALTFFAQGDESRSPIVERLAASVYKQAEQWVVAGDPETAAREFMRVGQVAPTASIAVTARYDAADTLMNAGRWAAAIPLLEAFRRDHPQHKLSENIPAKLVVAYREEGNWVKAADELTLIYQTSEDEAVKNESLYQAAELYEKAGDKDTAILRYRLYANTYSEPFPIAMEARYRLSELYRETGQSTKRRFWLRKIIAADASSGRQRTERSRYLAALSSTVLADDEYQTFAAIRLTLPIKQSLKRKKKALQSTLDAYRGVSDYGVEEFATLATFRIGEIYRQLSRDLMDSERPKDLDALALEQYEILLEEQAYPFEEKAIDIHEANSRRSWKGVYDEWVKKSFNSLKQLLPARYNKQEQGVNFASEIF